jgi:ATP-dependent helicase/nuclease subunit B
MSTDPANIRRHFLPWDRPLLPQAALWLAVGWEGKDPLDLSAVLALVPTRQSGRRLREALAEHAATRGSGVFPPRVLTPDALLTQAAAVPGVASRLEALLAWAEVFREIDLEEYRHVFPVDPPARNLPWALRLGEQFMWLQNVLAENGLRLADVASRTGEDFVESARWHEIAALELCHSASLASRHLCDPHAARIAVATRPPEGWDGFSRIVLIAVPDPQPLALEVLNAIAGARGLSIDVIVFAPEEESAAFDEWGRPLPVAWEGRVLDFDEFDRRVHLCADPATQAARVAVLAAAYVKPDGMLGIGVADPEVGPPLENELMRIEHPVFNPEGRPLRHEALYHLLASLAALVRDPSFAVVETLARCPDFLAFLRGRMGERFSVARWLAGLDELRARHLPADLGAAQEHAPGLAGHPEVGPGLAAVAHVRAVLGADDFAHGVAEALQTIYGTRQLVRTDAADERLRAAAAEWMTVVRECAAAERNFGPLIPADWWELALRLFGDRRRTDEKPAGALELQGWLELLWEDAPHLVVVGMNDGRVPEAVVEDAFLPAGLRGSLGLKTNEARFARDAYLLQAMVECRRQGGRLDLLFGKTSTAGDPLRPSRLLLRCADAELPRRISFLFRSPEPAMANAAWGRAWKLTPRAVPPPGKVAVTALRRYLQCPFRFYLRTVLRMESVDPLKSELDAFDFGTLCHSALEQIGRDAALRECTDAVVLRGALLLHLDRTVRARYGSRLALPLLVQVESARQRLAKLAELQAAERAGGWEIVHVERPFEVEISGLIVRGKIDRVDRQSVSGAVRVLDYKTSDTPVAPLEAHLRPLRPGDPAPDWARLEHAGKARAWSDLQLPLYLRALDAEFPGGLACGYFNLPKASGETALALWDDYTPELHASAMRCAEGACAAIRAGEFWPPNETLRAGRDECAALFHHGVRESVQWEAR